MPLPKVSVIIVNYNGKALLEKCLESLSKVNYENFEIIVVDNNSTDGSIELVTKNYPSIILLKLNSNKAKKVLSWECVLNFSETIDLTINWYKNFYNKNYRSVEDLSIKDLEYKKKKAKIL